MSIGVLISSYETFQKLTFLEYEQHYLQGTVQSSESWHIKCETLSVRLHPLTCTWTYCVEEESLRNDLLLLKNHTSVITVGNECWKPSSFEIDFLQVRRIHYELGCTQWLCESHRFSWASSIFTQISYKCIVGCLVYYRARIPRVWVNQGPLDPSRKGRFKIRQISKSSTLIASPLLGGTRYERPWKAALLSENSFSTLSPSTSTTFKIDVWNKQLQCTKSVGLYTWILRLWPLSKFPRMKMEAKTKGTGSPHFIAAMYCKHQSAAPVAQGSANFW